VARRFHQIACPARVGDDGAAEHDPQALVDAVAACLDAIQPRSAALDVEAIGIATYWHGLLGFDARGRPITPVYLWADTRSVAEAALLRGALDEEALHARTGCHLHSSYWPAKLSWLAREAPAPIARVARWGSVGELLEQAWFGEARTSLSIASATGLLDQARGTWDAEALAAAGIAPSELFPLVDRADGRRDLRSPWSARWPGLRSAVWLPAVGDGAASNVGAGCVDPSRIALNLGTSAALRVMAVGGEAVPPASRPGDQSAAGGEAVPPPSRPDDQSAVASLPRGLWKYRLDRTRALVGGATSEGGNVYAWGREHLRLPDDDAAIERALSERRPTDLTVLPFLAGERSPGWRGEKRGVVAGLALDTTALDVLGAMMEAVALRLALIYDLLAPSAAAGHTIVASGGALDRSPAWAQMIADALGRPIVRSTEAEATSRGIALLALEAIGRLPRLDAAPPPLGETLVPDAARHARARDALARQRDLDQRV
jgi:gluconokinase